MITESTPAQQVRLKADLYPMTVLCLSHPNLKAIDAELHLLAKQAPHFFDQTPVVIDVGALASLNELDIPNLTAMLRAHNVYLVGFKNVKKAEEALLLKHNLPLFSRQTQKSRTASPTPAEAPAAAHRPTRIIHKALRAGSKIYAKDSDLILLSSVNAGAECIADGNIHVYGPLRGRALAGASGDTQARLFCRNLQAELIAIAGHYWVSEAIHTPKTPYALLQIHLEQGQLRMTEL